MAATVLTFENSFDADISGYTLSLPSTAVVGDDTIGTPDTLSSFTSVDYVLDTNSTSNSNGYSGTTLKLQCVVSATIKFDSIDLDNVAASDVSISNISRAWNVHGDNTAGGGSGTSGTAVINSGTGEVQIELDVSALNSLMVGGTSAKLSTAGDSIGEISLTNGSASNSSIYATAQGDSDGNGDETTTEGTNKVKHDAMRWALYNILGFYGGADLITNEAEVLTEIASDITAACSANSSKYSVSLSDFSDDKTKSVTPTAITDDEIKDNAIVAASAVSTTGHGTPDGNGQYSYSYSETFDVDITLPTNPTAQFQLIMTVNSTKGDYTLPNGFSDQHATAKQTRSYGLRAVLTNAYKFSTNGN